MTTQELRTNLAADTGNWELRQALVEALVEEGLHDSAVEVVNEGESIPREAGLWLAAAKCYYAVGAGEQAQSLVASALEIDPEHAPSLAYQAQLQDLVVTPVALSADDVDATEEEPVAAIAAVAEVKGGTDGEPISLPKVSFSSDEMDALKEAAEEVKRRREATVKKDKFNSIFITVALHVVVIVLLGLVATKVPPRVPPQIVASAAPEQTTEDIESETLEKPTIQPNTAVNSAVADIISVNAVSNISISSLDVQVSDVAVQTSVSFNPSVSIGMPTSSESKMMFGQEMEGEVLGVILDVSGSMAEFLPAVVREVDKNFKDAPIVYVRNMLLRADRRDGEVRSIIAEEVKPFDEVEKLRTPYWFLWHDLPRKAPQRYVDRLIDTFKTRPNQFLTVGQWEQSSTDSAIDFLMEQEIDSLYVFSDFEDFVDEDLALELGQKLGRRKIRTYMQPAEKGSEFLDVMTKKVVNRTRGRQLPSLVSLLRGGDAEDEEASSLLTPPKNEKTDLSKYDITLAAPRDQLEGNFYGAWRKNKNWKEIHRIVEPEFDAIFYGPEARAEIFLKDANGKYIQNPITFSYHSRKYLPDHPDKRFRDRRRKFLRNEEEPTFDGKEIVWKMVLEDELKFEVHLYLGRKGMYATYVAEPPKDETYDNAFVYFEIPSLARENKDRFFGFDLPKEGVKLDVVRAAFKDNEAIINLPRQFRDRFEKEWAQTGFEMGYNTIKFDELVRRYPNGIRDLVVKGPAFGPREFHARTTSSKILLNGGAWRADSEPWESFHARLVRTRDERESFTKTEAIEIEIK